MIQRDRNGDRFGLPQGEWTGREKRMNQTKQDVSRSEKMGIRFGRISVRTGLFLLAFFSVAFYLGGLLTSSRAVLSDRSSGLLASASCESNGAVLSTGYFNNNVEALYYLDSQTGRLSAALLSRSDPEFLKTYTRNIKTDLQEALQNFSNVPVPPRPNFIMVSGDGDVRNVGAGEMNNLAKSFIYVAETQTGIVLVYILPLEGDRDLAVNKGEIAFWTFARLTSGTGIISPLPTRGGERSGSSAKMIQRSGK